MWKHDLCVVKERCASRSHVYMYKTLFHLTSRHAADWPICRGKQELAASDLDCYGCSFPHMPGTRQVNTQLLQASWHKVADKEGRTAGYNDVKGGTHAGHVLSPHVLLHHAWGTWTLLCH